MIIDIRKRAAYEQGHIPGALSFPFINKPGIWRNQFLDLPHPDWDNFKSAFASFLELHATNSVQICCQTGTWRSHALADLARSLGRPVQILSGGYNAYQIRREKILNQIYQIVVVAGEAGSGKTELLEELSKRGQQVVHLEKLAGHKGSAFGRLGQSQMQITKEQFKNDLAEVLVLMNLNRVIWLEDEGKSLGRAGIPPSLWRQMQMAPAIKLELPIEQRIVNILNQYGHIDRELLACAIQKIERRLGKAMPTAVAALRNNQMKTAVRLVLNYYDRAYALQLRGRNVILTIQMDGKDMERLSTELADRFTDESSGGHLPNDDKVGEQEA